MQGCIAVAVEEPGWVPSRLVKAVITQSVAERLSSEEILDAFQELFEKMQHPDYESPNMWTLRIAGEELWGILDQNAGGREVDVLTLLYPEDY